MINKIMVPLMVPRLPADTLTFAINVAKEIQL